MGGSQILKYLGTRARTISSEIIAAVVFSVPCDLGDSVQALSSFWNGFYRNRFLKRLKKKILIKAEQFPGKLDISRISEIRDFVQFDEIYTKKLLGLSTTDELYRYGSAIHYLSAINVPVLLINAKNDPMLPSTCYPFDIAREHPFLHLEIPERGGHVGFYNKNDHLIWSEKRAIEFISEFAS
jgi:predicted alpha/beta-fold hydrolase